MNYILTENLELVPTKNKYKFFTIGLFIILVGVNMIFFFREESIKIVYKVVHPTAEQSTDVELSEEAIVKCLHEHGCVLPNVALAQARLESNLGKSNVGKNAKNMFGIVHHKCKYVSGKYGVYAKYDTYQDNIKCYIHIQDHYLKTITGVYASDSEYIGKIKSLK